MDKTLLPIRLVFVALCAAGGWLVCYTIVDWDHYRGVALTVGLCIGLLVVLIESAFQKGIEEEDEEEDENEEEDTSGAPRER